MYRHLMRAVYQLRVNDNYKKEYSVPEPDFCVSHKIADNEVNTNLVLIFSLPEPHHYLFEESPYYSIFHDFSYFNHPNFSEHSFVSKISYKLDIQYMSKRL